MHNDDEFQDANGESIIHYRQLSIPYRWYYLMLFLTYSWSMGRGRRSVRWWRGRREEEACRWVLFNIHAISLCCTPNYYHLLYAPASITSLLFFLSPIETLPPLHSTFLLLFKRTLDPSSTTPTHTTYLTILHHPPVKLCYRQAQRRERGRQGLGWGWRARSLRWRRGACPFKEVKQG